MVQNRYHFGVAAAVAADAVVVVVVVVVVAPSASCSNHATISFDDSDGSSCWMQFLVQVVSLRAVIRTRTTTTKRVQQFCGRDIGNDGHDPHIL